MILFRKSIIAPLLALLILANPISALAKENPDQRRSLSDCVRMYRERVREGASKAKEATSAYIGRTIDNYGLNIIPDLTLRNPQTQVPPAYWGFLTKYDPDAERGWFSRTLSKTVQRPIRAVTGRTMDAPHELTLFKGLNELVQRPTRAITRQFVKPKEDQAQTAQAMQVADEPLATGARGVTRKALRAATQKFEKLKKLDNEKELTLLGELGLAFTPIGYYIPANAAFEYVFDFVLEGWDALLDVFVKRKIEEKKDGWDKWVNDDYRFKDLKSAREKKVMSAKQAREAAYLKRSMQTAAIEEWISTPPRPNEETLANDLANPLYREFIPLLQSGIADGSKDFRYAPGAVRRYSLDSPADRKILTELIASRKRELLEQELTLAVALQGSDLERLREDPNLGSYIKAIESDPFTQDLLKRTKKGEIEPKKLEYLLMEDRHWKAQLEIWKTMGLTRIDSKGAEVTLDRIRAETISELKAP